MDIASTLPRVHGQIRVRRLEHRDAAAFADGTSDEAVAQYAHLPLNRYTPQTVQAQIDGVIADGLADGSLAVLAVADSTTDGFLGSVVMFGIEGGGAGGGHAEVGFWLAPWARGRGAAGAALEVMVQLAADLGLDTLMARTVPENVPSQRVLESAGFERVGDPTVEAAPSGQRVALLGYQRTGIRGSALAGDESAAELLVISGLPGVGKTAVAAALVERRGAVHVSIDAVEEALLGAGLASGWTTGVAAYEASRAVAEMNLARGATVVVDAVNDSDEARQTWRTAATRCGVPLRFVHLVCSDPAEHRQRLQVRTRGFAQVTEPSWEDVQDRAARYAAWSDPHLEVDTAGLSLTQVVERIDADADAGGATTG